MHSIEGKEERRNSADNKAYRRHREGTSAPVQGHHGRVFYHQMKGDYYCYVCEFAKGALRNENSTKGWVLSECAGCRGH